MAGKTREKKVLRYLEPLTGGEGAKRDGVAELCASLWFFQLPSHNFGDRVESHTLP
jgi:hypothetical protein